MIYKNKKKLQRKMNKDVRELNQAIVEDKLWKGRFEIRQLADSYYAFEDGSGGIFTVHLRAIDKKTNKYADALIDYSGFNKSHIGRFMNRFITDYIHVWVTEDRNEILSDETDYTKIKSDYHLKEKASYKTIIYRF